MTIDTTAAITRLRASKKEHQKAMRNDGESRGRAWAANEASFEELTRLDRAFDASQYEGAKELFLQLQRDYDFWEETLGEEDVVLSGDENFIEAFTDGALEFLRSVASKLSAAGEDAIPLDVCKVRDALADFFEQQADWRKQKAEQYPEDARNAQSATGLTSLATYIRALADDASILTRFAQMPDAFAPGGDVFTPPSDPTKSGAGIPASRSGEEAGRYCFGCKDSPERFLADFAQTVEDEAREVAPKWAALAVSPRA